MFSGIKKTAKRNKEFRQKTRKLIDISSGSESDSDSFSEKSPLNYLNTIFNFNSESNTEVDDITNNLAHINLSPKMSVDNTNYQQLRLFLDIIPLFESDPCELNNFIAACDDTINTFRNENDAIKKLIFRGILGKLKGKALTLISSRAELNTWDRVKDVLRHSFSDQRSFTCLLNELHNLKPNPKETPYNFGIRCQYFRSLVFTSINNDSTMSAEAKIAQIGNIEKLLLITFIKYLPHQIQTGVRLKNPKCIEEAMNYVIEEENFLSLCSETKRNTNQHIPSPNFKAPTNQGYPQTYGHTPRTFAFPGFKQNFPSQPVNISPRQLPERKYFTNQQVFGNPNKTNVFKPTGKVFKDTPTPMSIVTRQSSIPRNISQPTTGNQFGPNNSQYRASNSNTFNQQSRPKFQFEELHNIDNSDDYAYECYQNQNFEEQHFENQNYTSEQTNTSEFEEQSHDAIEGTSSTSYTEIAGDENFYQEASSANFT